jgi:small-conductance mechanosensitive channel
MDRTWPKKLLAALAAHALAALLASCLFLAPAAIAQEADSSDAAKTAAKLPELTAAERTDLVAHLSDEQIRDLLLYYLGRAPAGAEEDADSLLGNVEETGETIRANALSVAAAADDVPSALGTAYRKLADDDGPLGIVLVAVALALFAAAGWAAERLYSAGVAGVRSSLRSRIDPAGSVLLPTFAILLVDLAGIVVFAAGYAAAFLALWQGNPERRQLAIALLAGILAVRLTQAFADFLFSPRADGPRIIPVSGEGARSLYDALVRIAVVGATALLAAYLIGLWSGERDVRLLFAGAAGAVFVAYFATSVWQKREHLPKARLAHGEAGADDGWGSRLLAKSWPVLIIAYAIVLYLAMLVAALAGASVNALSFLAALLLVVVGVPAANAIVEIILSRRSRSNAVDGDRPRLEARVSRRAARIVIAIVTLLILVRLFGVDLIAAANDTLGAWAARLILDIGLVVLVAYVLWELAVAAIDRKLAAEKAEASAHGELQAAQASRLTTLLPLLRRTLQGVILAVAALMILSALGVQIAPLLAGAGIFGLAVGFGAQTLVKDVISGLFFLLDDAFRVGEYIEVGSAAGTVERINTRSLTLRTPDGALHTIPFGGISAVANYSRDWAIVKMEFKVTHDTDLAKVKKIFRKIGEDLAQDPELAPGFLQPFKFQGVKAMEETGIIVRGKFMAVPGTQFQIRKQVFERVQKAFAEEGIDFAQRRVQVDIPAGHDLDEATKDKITAAAASAALASETTVPPR